MSKDKVQCQGRWLLQHARGESAFSTARYTSREGNASPWLLLPSRELHLPAAKGCPTIPGVHILAHLVLTLQGRDSEVEREAAWQVSLQASQGFGSKARGKDKTVTPESPTAARVAPPAYVLTCMLCSALARQKASSVWEVTQHV